MRPVAFVASLVALTLVACGNSSKELCEDAHREAVARDPSMAQRYPFERFVQACSELPEDAARCVSETFERAHRIECVTHEASIRALMTGARVAGPSIPIAAAPPRPQTLVNRYTEVTCSTTPHCSVGRTATGQFPVVGPPGTVVTVAGARYVVPAEGRGIFDVGIPRVLADAPLQAVVRGNPDTVAYRVPVTVQLPSGPVMTQSFELPEIPIQEMIGNLFRGVRQGPIAITPEGTGRAVVVIGPRNAEIVGPLTTLGDVSHVAFWTPQDRRSGTCGPYGGGSVPVRSIDRVMVDQHYEVYERRTGRRVGERTFSARSPRCPRTITGSTYSVPGYVESDAPIEAWMRTL